MIAHIYIDELSPLVATGWRCTGGTYFSTRAWYHPPPLPPAPPFLPCARYSYASCLRNAEGTERDLVQAVEVFERLAEGGFPEAQVN